MPKKTFSKKNDEFAIFTMLQNCEIVSPRCATVALFGKNFPQIKNNFSDCYCDKSEVE